jgi:hypothetical protein
MSGDSGLESSYLSQQLSIAQAELERNASLLEAMQVKLETAQRTCSRRRRQFWS